VKRITLFQIITILMTSLTIIVNGLANTLPLNGLETGEISDRFEIFFVPAGYVFLIWGLIYLGLIAFTIYQALPAHKENQWIKRISPAYWMASLANTAWMFLWHYEIFTVTLPVMLVILVSLLYIYLQLSKPGADLDAFQRWLMKVPFSIYLGWISVATIANASQVLFFYNWGGWGIPAAVWAVVMLITALIIGLIMNWRENDIPYVLVLVWAFAGIGVSQADTALVAMTAWTAAAILFITLISRPLIKRFG